MGLADPLHQIRKIDTGQLGGEGGKQLAYGHPGIYRSGKVIDTDLGVAPMD